MVARTAARVCVTLGGRSAAQHGQQRAGRWSGRRARALAAVGPLRAVRRRGATPGEDSNEECLPFRVALAEPARRRLRAQSLGALRVPALPPRREGPGTPRRPRPPRRGPGPGGGGRLRFSARSRAPGCRLHRTKIGHPCLGPPIHCQLGTRRPSVLDRGDSTFGISGCRGLAAEPRSRSRAHLR